MSDEPTTSVRRALGNWLEPQCPPGLSWVEYWALYWHVVRGRSPSAIAAMTGAPRATVQNRLTRGAAKLVTIRARTASGR